MIAIMTLPRGKTDARQQDSQSFERTLPKPRDGFKRGSGRPLFGGKLLHGFQRLLHMSIRR